MENVVSDMICGHPMTKHILTEKICGRGKPSCFHCHTNFVNFHGHRHIEVASCIPPSINHFDHETVSHICDTSQQQKDTFNFECCKAKLSKPANQMISCSPKGFKTREYELSIEKISGKIERIKVPISIPKRCCAEI
ncbi:Oidioi.mRNA.OKI2018_I69.PAR.g9491.t1.cds [Oikopleura dioica]|uniref:Oidioi.mRNA.OKI2018_I69.PAR.g9491.t1.cds n=1 Tax=Oikopleura dioica TaxID=34765 RepID=A0ABN7RKV5_OIKDI|nr:Oidioi.mRNA.OKI2018_I69.PAR.g9491.t1.cds [Oikopleura dioica]